MVKFLSNETGAECMVTEFERIEGYLSATEQKPRRLFLIDYREPRLREILKQAAFNGNGSPMSRRIISLFNNGKKSESNGKRQASACGILYRCNSASDLLNWICRLFSEANAPANGLTDCAQPSPENDPACPLTLRELQLLMMMTEGLRNQEIAQRLGISAHTVRTHLYNSFAKIGVRNRLEASAWIETRVSLIFVLI
jgi:DNA-binding NarL/FixJ family response regulator